MADHGEPGPDAAAARLAAITDTGPALRSVELATPDGVELLIYADEGQAAPECSFVPAGLDEPAGDIS